MAVDGEPTYIKSFILISLLTRESCCAGVCGDFDGDPMNDLALRDGTPSDDRNAISESYRMTSLPDGVIP